MTELCKKRHPHDIWRCDQRKGHPGDHTGGADHFPVSWKNHDARGEADRSRQNPRTPLKAGKGLNRVSNKQGERTSFLHGIKAERLRAMAGHDRRALGIPLRRYYCEGDCGYATNDFEEAWKILTVSHVEPRNDTSTRYERRREPDFRNDDPGNILLECIPCNGKREPQPEWTETA